MLELRDVAKSFAGRPALRSISLTVDANEYISLLGPSGSGKSTLLRVIAGFEAPDSGEVLLEGRRLTGVPAHERGIGFVFQNFALFPHLSVFDNVAFGLSNRARDPITDPAKLRSRVTAVLELVGLEALAARGIGQISGGQKQRVALARTLVADPRIILLDEPLGALDANLRGRMSVELKRIRRQLGITFIHVTGNEREALMMGDRVIVLDDGAISQLADPDSVFNRPGTARVAQLLSCFNILPGAFEAGAFRHGAWRLAVPTGTAASGPGEYAVRFDQIRVDGLAAGVTGAEPGRAALEAEFIASEYAGATMLHLFKLPDGRTFDVEYHLGHKRPEELTAGASYRLSWAVEDAIAYEGLSGQGGEGGHGRSH